MYKINFLKKNFLKKKCPEIFFSKTFPKILFLLGPTVWPEGPHRCSRRLQPSAGIRKMPPANCQKKKFCHNFFSTRNFPCQKNTILGPKGPTVAAEGCSPAQELEKKPPVVLLNRNTSTNKFLGRQLQGHQAVLIQY